MSDTQSKFLRAQPAGFSNDLEAWHARGDYADRDYQILERQEQPWRGGSLRVATVSHATPLGVRRKLALAFFEHAHGCLVMSGVGRTLEEARQFVERVPIDTAPEGVSVRLPVVADLRPPAALAYLPGLGQLVINPLTTRVLRELPARPGRRVAHGELYRASERSGAVLFVADTCRVFIMPEIHAVDLALAENLTVEWRKN